MTRIDSIESLADCNVLTLECGHTPQTTAPNVSVGQPWDCTQCRAERLINRRAGLALPKPEDVLDLIAEEYLATMQAQGIAIGAPERVAIRRAANIQYAWYCAMRAVLG